jgi:adenylate cyclase
VIRNWRPTALRFVEDVVGRLSRDRLARGDEPLSAEDLRAALDAGPEHVERTVLSYALGLGPPRYTLHQAAARVSLETETVVRLWMAFGFARPVGGDVVFTDGDLEALAEVGAALEEADLAAADVLQLARLVGRSFARVSDAAVGILASSSAAADDLPNDDTATALRLAAAAGTGSMATMDRLLVYAWKRHLGAAIRRAAARDGGTSDVELSVGFADISGFSVMSNQLDHRALGRLLDAFHAAADTAVVGHGGRIVKTIGDEIMFVVSSPDAAVDIGLDLAKGFRDEERQVSLHVGIAHGAALRRDGDFYGSTVNRAKRLTEAAGAGQVCADEYVRAAVDGLRREALTPADRR